MANRIKRVLPTVISDAQFAFVGSRRINILLVQELFHGYHLNNGSRRKRGLKQRDPPSTYLFVIAMEYLGVPLINSKLTYVDYVPLFEKANLCSFRHSIGDAPWIVLGDFNVVRSTGEIDGGSNLRSNVIIGFGDCLLDVELDDLRFSVKNSKATNDCCQVSLVSIHTNLSLAELEKTLLKNYSGSLVMDESFVKRKSRV
ncbi:hypothetical protein ACFX2H_027427 [Malus domestica]